MLAVHVNLTYRLPVEETEDTVDIRDVACV